MAYPMLYLCHADVAVGFDDFDDVGEFKDLRNVADTFRLNPVTLTIGGMKLNMHQGTYASTNLQVRLHKIHEVEPAKGSTADNPISLGGMAAAGAQKLTAKQWTGQRVPCYVDRVSDRASRSYTRPKNPRTFRDLRKWESFSQDVIKFFDALDDREAIYNALVWHALDGEHSIVQEVRTAIAPADEQEVRGPLLTTVLQPVSEVAGHLGCRLSYTGNGSGRSASFTDLLVKVRQRSSHLDLSKLILAVIEVKGPWQFDIPDDLHLVDALESSHRGRVVEVVQQALGDAISNQCPFMVIATGKTAYFLKRNFHNPTDPGPVVWCSPPVTVDSTAFPPLAAWMYLLFEAEKQLLQDGTKRPEWLVVAPDTPKGGFKMMLDKQVVNLNARYPQGHNMGGVRQQPKRKRSSGGGSKQGAAELQCTTSVTGASGELVVVTTGTDVSSSGTGSNSSSNPGSNRSSNSSIGEVLEPESEAARDNAAAAAAEDVFDATAWAQRHSNGDAVGIARAIAAVEDLPFLPEAVYSCYTACFSWSSGKAVYKGKVLGQHDVFCKVFNSRSDSGLQNFFNEAIAYVELAGQLGRSVIPLLGLGRQPHTGDPMLVVAAGEPLPSVLSREQQMSAEAALQSIHAAGRLHGDVHHRNMLLYGNHVVWCDLENSIVSNDAQAFEKELLQCREGSAHIAPVGGSD